MTDMDDFVDHAKTCLKIDAAVVADGSSGDPIVAELLAKGWTMESTSSAGGKRVRVMIPPSGAEA